MVGVNRKQLLRLRVTRPATLTIYSHMHYSPFSTSQSSLFERQLPLATLCENDEHE